MKLQLKKFPRFAAPARDQKRIRKGVKKKREKIKVFPLRISTAEFVIA